MQSNAITVDKYISELPSDRKEAIERLRAISLKNLPKGFEESIGYGMLGYTVPHSLYPNGYHCDPKQPLPFFGMASQKNSINLYHMGIYVRKDLYDWFVERYPKYTKAKLDMGKSCIRFKKPEHIPYELIGELLTKITVADWIAIYEEQLKPKK
ncbi:DUF1801 domain-containing protein [Flavobacterium orientale]|uniref:YdhG-like domain-containing protein n=1 Tax=Flavobacterium orientale TaxID=1756020 RepID=A0A917DAV5_9FLAO|nr:DUF1801 domain-containing protein [Flavobacterium orientale]GGD24135.1 hypothetical protein GCM10011343_12900 [Flavobacterium orientale]